MRFSTQTKIPESCDINFSRRVFFPEPDPLRELSFGKIQLFEIRKIWKIWNLEFGQKTTKKKFFANSYMRFSTQKKSRKAVISVFRDESDSLNRKNPRVEFWGNPTFWNSQKYISFKFFKIYIDKLPINRTCGRYVMKSTIQNPQFSNKLQFARTPNSLIECGYVLLV